MRTRLEVDGQVLAATREVPPRPLVEGGTRPIAVPREGMPEDVAGELAEELRRIGAPAVAKGTTVHAHPPVASKPPLVAKGPAKAGLVDRDLKPEKRRRRSGGAS